MSNFFIKVSYARISFLIKYFFHQFLQMGKERGGVEIKKHGAIRETISTVRNA